MLEYQSSNLRVVTREASGAARSVWWGSQSLNGSSNAVWGGTGLPDARGPVHFCSMRLGYDFYPISPPPPLCLFLRRHSALPGGRHCLLESFFGKTQHPFDACANCCSGHPFQICERSERIPREYRVSDSLTG